jgi:hypothetical protein
MPHLVMHYSAMNRSARKHSPYQSPPLPGTSAETPLPKASFSNAAAAAGSIAVAGAVASNVRGRTADACKPCDESVPRWGRRRGLEVHAVHGGEQAPVVLGQAGDRGLAPGRSPFARRPLQHPSAEGIELPHSTHVDRDTARARGLTGEAPRDLFQFAGMGAVQEPAAASSSRSPSTFPVSNVALMT